MPRVHIHVQQEYMVVCLEATELGYVLRRLMEEDL